MRAGAYIFDRLCFKVGTFRQRNEMGGTCNQIIEFNATGVSWC